MGQSVLVNFPANDVTVSDVGRYFDSANVEGALQEIGDDINALDVMTTRGDIVYRNASAPTRLPVGIVGQVLKSNGADPVWATQTEIKTNTTAPTDLTIITGSDKTLVLDTPVYDDIIISASNLRPGSSAPLFASFVSPVFAMKFLNGDTDIAYGAFEIPHDYKEGTDIEIHVHWSPSTTNTGDCVWKFNAVWAGMGAGAFVPIAEMTATDAGNGVAFAHQYASFGNIAGVGHKIGDIIAFELKRPSGDSFSGDAFLLSIGAHYKIDTIGSRTKSAK